MLNGNIIHILMYAHIFLIPKHQQRFLGHFIEKCLISVHGWVTNDYPLKIKKLMDTSVNNHF